MPRRHRHQGPVAAKVTRVYADTPKNRGLKRVGKPVVRGGNKA